MERRYDSFLVRYWHWSRAERRVEVEHFQSGQRTRVRSMAEALAWIEARESEKEAGESARPEEAIAKKRRLRTPAGEGP